MSVINILYSWLLSKDLRAATALGFVTIPVTLFSSWNTLPYEYNAAPALFAGFLGGLYYSNEMRSPSPTQAGLRIGVISALDSFLLVPSLIASGWAISPVTAVLTIAFGALWFVFSLIVLSLISVIGARVGGFVGRLPPFRRGEPQTT
ncbi:MULTISPECIES: DUF5518 domain-containing protein [Halomicrobium]|uniref:DUF5518 domain-containing protein n=1 Tax=Halomicrobium TaxID=203135 RepID=UPI0013DF9159